MYRVNVVMFYKMVITFNLNYTEKNDYKSKINFSIKAS